MVLIRSKKLLLAGIAALIFLPIQVHATTLVYRGFEELIQRSGIIFEGEVISQYSAYADDKKSINTFVTFTVDQVLKGTIDQSTIELRFVGGKVGNVTVVVPEMPKFEKGDRTILLLDPNFNPTKTFSPISGFNQGQFLVKSNEIFNAHGMKIVGYEGSKDRLEIISTQEPQKRNVPIPLDPKKDVLVKSTNRYEKNSSALTKDQFVQMISNFVKKHGLKGSQLTPLNEKEKHQTIHFEPASAPEIKAGAK